LHLPGGRQLFVMTGGALWTQQRSSGVCYKRRKEEIAQCGSPSYGNSSSFLSDLLATSLDLMCFD